MSVDKDGYKVQTENKSFVRDTHSKALLQSDRRALDEYKLKSKMIKSMKTKDEELNNIKQQLTELDTVKKDLEEIKNLLKGLVNK